MKSKRFVFPNLFAMPLVLTGLLMLGGCRARLADQRTMELGTGEIETVAVAGVAHAQEIFVTATSAGSPINAHVFLFADEDEVERSITLHATTDKILAEQLNTNEINLTATIPANQEAAVRISTVGRENAKISIKISN